MKGYESRTAYWESYMTEKQIIEHKSKLLLLNEEGCWEPQYIYPSIQDMMPSRLVTQTDM